MLVIPEIWQILQTILPELTRRDHLLWLYRLQEHKQYKLPAFIYLAAGVEDGEMALEVSRRLRCSNNEQQALMQIISGAEVAEVDENILKGWLVDYGRENTRLTYLLVLSKNLALPHASYLQYIKDEPIPQFPLKGADLLHEGVEANAKMGALLQRAKTLWRNSGYTMQRAELISAALERGKK